MQPNFLKECVLMISIRSPSKALRLDSFPFQPSLNCFVKCANSTMWKYEIPSFCKRRRHALSNSIQALAEDINPATTRKRWSCSLPPASKAVVNIGNTTSCQGQLDKATVFAKCSIGEYTQCNSYPLWCTGV